MQSVLILTPKNYGRWEGGEKHLQMSSFQAVEIILPLKGVKFCFLSVKNAWSCVTLDCHPCGEESLWCGIILQHCSYIHKSHSETYEQCYEVSVWKKKSNLLNFTRFHYALLLIPNNLQIKWKGVDGHIYLFIGKYMNCAQKRCKKKKWLKNWNIAYSPANWHAHSHTCTRTPVEIWKA